MNFLGIGPFELLLVLVIATIILGPERMAQAGRTLGRLYGQYRTRWQKDVDEMTRELRRELEMLQQEVEDIRQTAESEIRSAQAALEDAVDLEEVFDVSFDVESAPDAAVNAQDEPDAVAVAETESATPSDVEFEQAAPPATQGDSGAPEKTDHRPAAGVDADGSVAEAEAETDPGVTVHDEAKPVAARDAEEASSAVPALEESELEVSTDAGSEADDLDDSDTRRTSSDSLSKAAATTEAPADGIGQTQSEVGTDEGEK